MSTAGQADLKLQRIGVVCKYFAIEQNRRDILKCLENAPDNDRFNTILFVLRSTAAELYNQTVRGAEFKQRAMEILYSVQPSKGYKFFFDSGKDEETEAACHQPGFVVQDSPINIRQKVKQQPNLLITRMNGGMSDSSTNTEMTIDKKL